MFVTIATFINGLADMIINAVAGHNWWEIGAKIANGLIDGLKKFDAAKAGRAIHDFFKALLDTINGFIATMSKKQLVSTPDNSVDGFMYEYKTGWEIIADKINEFIENLDLEDLGTSTGTATSGMLNGFFKVLTGADFGEGVKAFIDGFMDGMKNYPWQSSMHDFWDVFYPKLKSFLKWAGPKLGELIKEVWETIKGPVLEIALEIGKQIGEGILAGIKGVTDKTSDFTEKLFNPTEAAMYAAKDLQDKKDEAYQEQLDTIRSWTSAERETYEQVIDKLPSWARKGYDEKRKDIEQSSAAIKTAYNGTANAIEAGNIKIEKSNESLGKSAQQTGQTAGNSFSTMGTQASDMAAVVASSFDETTMAMQTSMDAVQPMANNAYNSITGTFDQVPSYFSDTFGQAWNEVQKSLSPSGALAQGLAIGTNKIVNVSVNKMVDAINSVAIAPLQRLSNLMDKLRGVTIGGLTPFAGLPKLNFFKIPKLARGAVLPPNQPFLSIVGDQKQGTNVEAPLETIKQAVAEVMGDNEEAMMAGFEAVVRAIQNKDLSVRIGDRDIGQANDRYNQRLATMRGV